MRFFNRTFPGLWVKLLVLLSHIPHKKSKELPLACYLNFSLGYGYPHSFLHNVKHFDHVSVSLVINAGCVKKFPVQSILNAI